MEKIRLPAKLPQLRYFSFMKIHPYACILCAAVFMGLPLLSISAPAADEEEIPASVLKKYDANKDGMLDETEKAVWQADKEKQRAAREARRAEDLARYDADKDGKLEKDERAVMKADDEKVRAEKKAAQEARKGEKAAAIEAKKLAKYDKNQNGKLDEDELAARKADEEKYKAAAEKRKATMAARQQAGAAKEAQDDEPSGDNP
jgi:Ca2+-binding EF-hand superfamily protein